MAVGLTLGTLRVLQRCSSAPVVLESLHSTHVWGARTPMSLAQQCFLQQEPFLAPGTHLEAHPACWGARRRAVG